MINFKYEYITRILLTESKISYSLLDLLFYINVIHCLDMATCVYLL
jgi:hypothetical protein